MRPFVTCRLEQRLVDFSGQDFQGRQ
jgi:hypothetical protein